MTRELLHKGSKFDFERLTFSGNAGASITRECIRHPGSVIIAPIWHPPGGEPHLILIENWRLSNEQWMIELPAGTRTPGEDPALCAARELTEETGFIAGHLEPLCSFHTAPGLTDELMHAFVATSLTPAAQHLEDDERIRVLPTPLREVPSLLTSGKVTDAKTLLLLHLLDRRPPDWLLAPSSAPV